jgi:hypothetical protein
MEVSQCNDGVCTNSITVWDTPTVFEKGAVFEFGLVSPGFSMPYTNMFFNSQCVARILTDDEKRALAQATKYELEERGRISYACEFDGVDDYVVIPYRADLFQELMTVSFWVDTETVDYGGNVYLVRKYESTTNKRAWAILVNMSNLITIFTSANGLNISNKSSTQQFELGKHLITFVVDNQLKTWSFYYDGVFSSTLILGESFRDFEIPLTLDKTKKELLMDDVIMYGRLLSASEVLDLYEGRDVDKTSLVLDCQSAPSDSKFHSQRTPMPSNGFRDTASNTNLVNSGTGELGIERNDN